MQKFSETSKGMHASFSFVKSYEYPGNCLCGGFNALEPTNGRDWELLEGAGMKAFHQRIASHSCFEAL